MKFLKKPFEVDGFLSFDQQVTEEVRHSGQFVGVQVEVL
jgi:hypothetical protein